MTTYYSPTPTWPPKDLSDNEQILDFMRQQMRRQMEQEEQAKVENNGVNGVRWHLAQIIDEGERLDEFPAHVLDLLRIAYDTLWAELRK